MKIRWACLVAASGLLASAATGQEPPAIPPRNPPPVIVNPDAAPSSGGNPAGPDRSGVPDPGTPLPPRTLPDESDPVARNRDTEEILDRHTPPSEHERWLKGLLIAGGALLLLAIGVFSRRGRRPGVL